jgi:TetR/AcrR family transcriptional regulator, transcriptional repressor for nem operon
MRYPRDRKIKTRTQILAAAATLLRSRGIDGTGVDAVMSAVGLTAGGFYAHFRSKDALVADAIEAAGAQAARRWHGGLEALEGRAYARALLDRYLSTEHRDDRAGGCILPALGAEMPRARRSSRRRFEQRLLFLLDHMTERLAMKDARGVNRDEVIASVALSVGGLVLSRAVTDRALADQILSASRKGAGRLLGLSLPAAARRRA